MPAGPPAADLDATIARIEAHCAACFRALAARPHERDARLLRALLSLDMEELADLRAAGPLAPGLNRSGAARTGGRSCPNRTAETFSPSESPSCWFSITPEQPVRNRPVRDRTATWRRRNPATYR